MTPADMGLYDDPDACRFWLWFETRSTTYRQIGRELHCDHHKPLRITVEVSEANYRKAYAEAIGHDAGDITLPLDDYWWNDVPVGRWDSDWSVRRCRGGKMTVR